MFKTCWRTLAQSLIGKGFVRGRFDSRANLRPVSDSAHRVKDYHAGDLERLRTPRHRRGLRCHLTACDEILTGADVLSSCTHRCSSMDVVMSTECCVLKSIQSVSYWRRRFREQAPPQMKGPLNLSGLFETRLV